MNLREKVLMRSLQQKQLNEEGHLAHGQGDIIDTLAAQNPGKLRNLCAHVTPELYQQVDDVCSTLNMSKRDFITTAVLDGLATARRVMESTGLNASFAALATEANITVEEAGHADA